MLLNYSNYDFGKNIVHRTCGVRWGVVLQLALYLFIPYINLGQYMTHQFQGFSEWEPENTVLLANNFRQQWPIIYHTGISCCCFRVEGFLFPVAIKPPFFARKCLQMRKDLGYDSGA